jgi:hypothetical protein
VRGDIVVMLDADGSADPAEIPLFVDALVRGADFAKGTRFASGGGSSDITVIRAWGNRWLNRTANTLFGTGYTDLCYGYNAFWATCLPGTGARARRRAAGPQAVGRRLRDRDDHQHPHRQGQPAHRRGPQLRVRPHPRPEQPQHLARRHPRPARPDRRTPQPQGTRPHPTNRHTLPDAFTAAVSAPAARTTERRRVVRAG